MKVYEKIIGAIFLMSLIFIISKSISLDLDIYAIKEYINSFDKIAPLVYIVMFALVPLTFFPDSILAIASGLIFGFYEGYIYTTIGALIGASIAFFLAKYFGHDIIKKVSLNKLNEVEKIINNNGFYIIFLLRLIPLFPFDIISYGAGLANVNYKSFISATLLGTIPGIIVFTNIGAKSVDISSSGFYLSIAMLVLLFLLSFILKSKFLNNNLNKS